jgi:hypothetical protein
MSGLVELVRQAGWDAALAGCFAEDKDGMAESAATVDGGPADGRRGQGRA